MDKNLKELFTPDHKLLMQFSKIGSIFAWAVLVGYALVSLAQIPLVVRQVLENNQEMIPLSIAWMTLDYPVSLIVRVIYILDYLLFGVVNWFVLKGISLGLKMIVETDLIYRGKSTGKNDEQ